MANPKSHLFSLSFFSFLLLHFPTVSLAQTLFVFGDGLYDTGNKQIISSNRVDASFPPYGNTLGEATGRWSDGLIIPDYLGIYYIFLIPFLKYEYKNMLVNIIWLLKFILVWDIIWYLSYVLCSWFHEYSSNPSGSSQHVGFLSRS